MQYFKGHLFQFEKKWFINYKSMDRDVPVFFSLPLDPKDVKFVEINLKNHLDLTFEFEIVRIRKACKWIKHASLIKNNLNEDLNPQEKNPDIDYNFFLDDDSDKS